MGFFQVQGKDDVAGVGFITRRRSDITVGSDHHLSGQERGKDFGGQRSSSVWLLYIDSRGCPG